MSYQPIPNKIEDGEVKVRSSNDRLLDMAAAIESKLAIVVEHLSILTKEDISEHELRDN